MLEGIPVLIRSMTSSVGIRALSPSPERPRSASEGPSTSSEVPDLEDMTAGGMRTKLGALGARTTSKNAAALKKYCSAEFKVVFSLHVVFSYGPGCIKYCPEISYFRSNKQVLVKC